MALCSGSGGSVLGSGRSPTLFLTRNVSAFLVRIWLPVGSVWFGSGKLLHFSWPPSLEVQNCGGVFSRAVRLFGFGHQYGSEVLSSHAGAVMSLSWPC